LTVVGVYAVYVCGRKRKRLRSERLHSNLSISTCSHHCQIIVPILKVPVGRRLSSDRLVNPIAKAAPPRAASSPPRFRSGHTPLAASSCRRQLHCYFRSPDRRCALVSGLRRVCLGAPRALFADCARADRVSAVLIVANVF